MEWYKVVKTINGRKYLYWQKTYRQGSSVKTLNKYIGPGPNPPRAQSLKAIIPTLPQRHQELRAEYDAGKITKVQYLEAITTPPTTDRPAAAAFRAAAPFATALEAVKSPEYQALIKENKKRHKALKPVALSKSERAEEERIQYGSLKARIKKHQSKLAAAKRNTKGIKKQNPFIAQGIAAPTKKKRHGWDSWRNIAKNNRETQRYLKEKEAREIPNAWWRRKDSK